VLSISGNKDNRRRANSHFREWDVPWIWPIMVIKGSRRHVPPIEANMVDERTNTRGIKVKGGPH